MDDDAKDAEVSKENEVKGGGKDTEVSEVAVATGGEA